MDSTLESGLAAIAADREHGAAHIAIDGMWLLSPVCEAALMRNGAGAVRAACSDRRARSGFGAPLDGASGQRGAAVSRSVGRTDGGGGR